MSSPLVDVSTGWTIAFGTSGFTAEIVDPTPPGFTREAINTSHQGTVGAHTYMPADLYDTGSLTFSFHFNPDTDPPIDEEIETITMTSPAGATWAFDGFMTNYQPGEMTLNNKMTGTAEFKVSGAVSITPAT